jgi:L,D-transpeptidase YcbB
MYMRYLAALVLAMAAIPAANVYAQESAAQETSAQDTAAQENDAQEVAAPEPAAPARVANAEPATEATAPEPPAPATQVVPEPQDPLAIAIKARFETPASQGDEQDRAEREALKAFYAGRTYAPLWVGTEGLNAKAEAAIAEIKKADDWGLEASAFALPAPATASSDPAALAEAEATLSSAIVKYARFARGGRIMDPTSDLSSYLDRKPQLIETKTVMSRIAAANAPDAVLRGFHPQHPQFEKLRQAYLAMRDGTSAHKKIVRVPSGPMLRPGMTHPNVAVLRKRLKVATPAATAEAAADETLFDETLREAVVAFQKKKGLSPDGLVGSGTLAALNDFEVPSTDRLLANMEQWRWMPENMGDLYVWVNIPEFTVRVVKGGEAIHTERVVTGLVGKQTPVFSENLKEVIFRPRWNVPNSIKVNELYPNLARGGNSFQRQGLRLSQNGRPIDPYSVNWDSADIRRFDVYQPPGPRNVLGVVKFAFPNKHLVYMHDTPSKHLFERTSRPYSHGCIRVRNPARLAEVLLDQDKGWEAAKVDELIDHGPGDNHVQVERTIPVHVTYFTAWVDDEGKTKVASDVYGHEKRINQALAGKWQQIAKGRDHLAPVRLQRVDDGGGFFSWGGGGSWGGNSRGKPKSVGDYMQQVLGGGF